MPLCMCTIQAETASQLLLIIFVLLPVLKMSSGNDSCGPPRDDKAAPKLIVFDLDYTLWPFWVDTHVDPPFAMKGSKVVDSRGKTIKYFPEVPEVLEYIRSLGIPMAIASRTGEIDGANQLLRLFDWDKYFQYKEIYPGCKITHFSRFQKATGLSHNSMMFFDDEERNIRDLSKEGVHCVFVRKGVTMKLLKDSLREFKNKNTAELGWSKE
ncbi:Magnesium-dependent phosphatase 1 [Orchesella cincta]|uniref:Magnesium-dependent phosphatase 1 n=1 Tax=Orchesella cincta TaxID=48709 RepID=A0A1D2N4Z5_ORCCI|nr:Magnesium-dependent phosphatase 1 [Orchesella cincta]